MMRRSSIFIADLAAALDALDVRDRATAARIADLLGIDVEEQPHVTVESAPMLLQETSELIEEAGEPEPIEPPPSYRYIASAVQSASPSSEEIPELRLQRAATPLMLDASERGEPRLAHTPLLRASSTRAILAAALSTGVVAGIDLPRAVRLVVRREPFEHLPMKMLRSVRRGAQLLVDKSAGMAPFFRDQAWLSEWIVRVIGRQQVETASFRRVPQHGLHRGMKRRRAYRPPPRGTPIVLLTDLGIADASAFDEAASPAEWLEFASLARRAGCPVLAFVPYASERWPRELRRAMTILRWDRRLTAGRAAKAVSSRLR